MRAPKRIVLLTLLAGLCGQATWAQSPMQLPGARPVVDAGAHGSLQAAVDALPEEGGVVRIPPGVFEIDQPLTVRVGDVLLEGSGSATVIKNVNQDGQPTLILGSGEVDPKRSGRFLSIWRVALTRLRLEGNPKCGHGILAQGVDEIFLEGISVSHHGGDGILLDHCFEDPRINDCLITYNKKAGLHLIGCHDIVVSGNHFEENGDGVRCVDGFNLTMSGNNLDDHLGSNVVLEQMMGSVISGNMFEEAKGWAVIVDRDTYGVTISANVFSNNTSGGVDLRDAQGCTVSANTFSIMPRHAVAVEAASGRITITGNTFTNAYFGDGVVYERAGESGVGSGITLRGGRELTIVGNTFSGVRPGALCLEGPLSADVLFSNNVLIDCPVGDEGLERSEVRDNLVR